MEWAQMEHPVVSTETYPTAKVKVDATEVRKRFRLVCDAEAKQRERERWRRNAQKTRDRNAALYGVTRAPK